MKLGCKGGEEASEGKHQTAHKAEVTALKMALRGASGKVVIHSDSKYVCGRLK